jgi:hypothetical protein
LAHNLQGLLYRATFLARIAEPGAGGLGGGKSAAQRAGTII